MDGGTRRLGGGCIGDDFHHRGEGGVGIAVGLEGGMVGEDIMDGVILIGLDRGVRTGGMIGGVGVRVIVVILAVVRRLREGEVGLGVGVRLPGEGGIEVLVGVVVLDSCKNL